MSGINTPTYFVQHPDGSLTMANPQPIPEFEWQFKDGGPVHPCRMPTGGLHMNNEPEPTKLHFGMSLRDYFAAKAMQGDLAAMQDPDGGVCGVALDAPNDTFERLARHYYRMADAMIKARKEGNTE